MRSRDSPASLKKAVRPSTRTGRIRPTRTYRRTRAGGSRVQTVSPNLAGIPDTGLTQVLAELELPAEAG